MSDQKAKFFAQYWGCNVLYVGGVGFQRVGFGRWNLRHPDFFIELTPLSQISDEDAIEVAKILDPMQEHGDYRQVLEYIDEFDMLLSDQIERNGAIVLNVFDYLRSKGYALPWLGISVEEQIKLGWIKLKDNE